LGYGKHRLEIYEHAGALRWTGLDYIAIQSSKWPPYFGRIAELWNALEPYCVEGEGNIPWIVPCGQIRSTSLEDDSRFIEISPRLFNGLYLLVKIDMPGIGNITKKLELPGDLTDCFSALTLGWPSCLHRLSLVAKKIIHWPHHEHIVWQREMSKENLLKEIVLHRTADFLGGLSLASHDKLVSGDVISQKGNHWLDVSILRDIQGPF